MRPKQKISDTMKVISDNETYPLPLFMESTGMGRHAMRQARLMGLKVVKMGSRIYVRGKDFSEFLGTLAADGEVAQ